MKRVTVFLLAVCMLFLIACERETNNAATEKQSTEPVTETEMTVETTELTVPVETVAPTQETEAATVQWPEDAPYLPVYWDTIRDYKTILEYRLSKKWDEEKPLPDLSNTFQKALDKDKISDDFLRTMILEAVHFDDDRLKDFGYILYDLDGNKIPELFWVRKDYSIVAVFTYYKEELRILDMYWSRYRGNIADNGQYFTCVSDGAADNSCNIYILNKGKLEEVFCFYRKSDEKADTVGYYETASEVEIEIDEARFKNLSADFSEDQNFLEENCTVYSLDKIPGEKLGENKKEAVPYKQKVKRADQSIFAGPGSTYSWVGTTEEPGTFTITNEVRDEIGNLWGRLKSGRGWINLTQVKETAKSTLLISANYADKALLDGGNYHHCIADDSEYMVQVAFRAYEKLTNISLFEIIITEEADLEEEVFSLSEMDRKKPLVADLGFPGDMSMYGIRFTDKNGKEYTYAIAISGRDGSLELFPYKD